MSQEIFNELVPVALLIGAASGHIKCPSPAAKSLWGAICCDSGSTNALQPGGTWDAERLSTALSNRLGLLATLITPHLAATLLAELQEQLARGLRTPETWGLVLLPSPSPGASHAPTDVPIDTEQLPAPVDGGHSPAGLIVDRLESPGLPHVVAGFGSSRGPDSWRSNSELRSEEQQGQQQQQEEEEAPQSEQRSRQLNSTYQLDQLGPHGLEPLDPNRLDPHQQYRDSIGHDQELRGNAVRDEPQLQQPQQQEPQSSQDSLMLTRGPSSPSSLLGGPPYRRLAPPRHPLPLIWRRVADDPLLPRRPPPPSVNAGPNEPYTITDRAILPNNAPANTATAAANDGANQGITLMHDLARFNRGLDQELSEPGPGPGPRVPPLTDASPLHTAPRPSPPGVDPGSGPHDGPPRNRVQRHDIEDSARGIELYTRIHPHPDQDIVAGSGAVMQLPGGIVQGLWAHDSRRATSAARGNAGARRLAAPVFRTEGLPEGEQRSPSSGPAVPAPTPVSASVPVLTASGDGAAWQAGAGPSTSMRGSGTGGSRVPSAWSLPDVVESGRVMGDLTRPAARFGHLSHVAPIQEAAEGVAMGEERLAVQVQVEVAGRRNEDVEATEAEVESAVREMSLTQLPPAGVMDAGDATLVGMREDDSEQPQAEDVDAEFSPFTGVQAAVAAASSVSDSGEYSPLAGSHPDHQPQSVHEPQRQQHAQHPYPHAVNGNGNVNATGGRGPRFVRRRSTRGRLHALLATHLGTGPARQLPAAQQLQRDSGGGGGDGGLVGQGRAVEEGCDDLIQGSRGQDIPGEQQQQQEAMNLRAVTQSYRCIWYMIRLRLILPRAACGTDISAPAEGALAADNGGPSISAPQPPLAARAATAAAPRAAAASGDDPGEPLLLLVLYDVDELIRYMVDLEGDLAALTVAAVAATKDAAAARQREAQMASMLTREHKVLEAVFPRQAIEHMMRMIGAQHSHSPPITHTLPPPAPPTSGTFSSRSSILATRAAIAPTAVSTGTYPATAAASRMRFSLVASTALGSPTISTTALPPTAETYHEPALLPPPLIIQALSAAPTKTSTSTAAAAVPTADSTATTIANDGRWGEQGGRTAPRRLRIVPLAPPPSSPRQMIATAPIAVGPTVDVPPRTEGLAAGVTTAAGVTGDAGVTGGTGANGDAGVTGAGAGLLSQPAVPQQHHGRVSLVGLAADGGAGGAAGAMAAVLLAFAAPKVTVLFADIVGFTPMCTFLQPLQVMSFLNDIFMRFDSLCDIFGVYKVETIGDCYMVVGGLITVDVEGFKAVRGDDSEDTLHALKVMSFAKAMLREVSNIRMPHDDSPLRLRVGLHSGPVTAGIVGAKMPRFCLFGDTVNTASRMESTCAPGCIHVSAATMELLPEESWRPTGGVHVKGKGEMETYLWNPPPDFTCLKSGFSASASSASEANGTGGYHYPGAGGSGASAVERPRGWGGPVGLQVGGGAAGGRSAVSDGELVRQQMILMRAAAAAAVAAGAGGTAPAGGPVAAAAPVGQGATSEPSAPQ